MACEVLRGNIIAIFVVSASYEHLYFKSATTPSRKALVIVKQMLIQGMETSKDFTESDEALASNILSSENRRINHILSPETDETSHDNKSSHRAMIIFKATSLRPVKKLKNKQMK